MLKLVPANDVARGAGSSETPRIPPFRGRFHLERKRSRRRLFLALIAFNVGVVLDALGLFVLLFLVIGGLTFDGLFVKTATVSFAFLFGTPEQQAEIRTQVLCVGLLFFNLAVIMRAGTLKALFDAHLGGRHGR